MKILGTFEITSGKMIVSDPGFDYKPEGPNDDMKIYDVPNGKWLTYIININKKYPQIRNKIRNLLIHHNSLTVLDLEWKNLDSTIGIDSGLVGFFDSNHYQNNETIPEDFKKQGKTWYDVNCTPCQVAQTIPFGVVSKSQYGDPIYNVYGAYKDNQLVGLRLRYTEGEEVEESDGEHNKIESDDEDETNNTNTQGKPIRYFKLIYEGLPSGRFTGTKPKKAANKALTYIIKEIKKQQDLPDGQEIKFSIQECSRGCKRKTYAYKGCRTKVDPPMQVKIGDAQTGVKIIEYNYMNRVIKDKQN